MLRLEDTDKERSKDEHVQSILAALEWLDLAWDDEPIHQSQRLDKYQQAAQRLLDAGKAYRCTCTAEELEKMREEQSKSGVANPKYDGRHRDSNLGPDTKDFVVRFKAPQDGEVAFTDLVQGEIRVSNEELDDLVLLRADGTPTYNFCAVVDDLEMGVSHVIRGDDHLRNSLRQCNLYNALGSYSALGDYNALGDHNALGDYNALGDAKLPQFAHLPMILNQEGKRLSKREGADDVLNFRSKGVLPAALCSYMARLGWSAGDQEIFSRAELLDKFELKAVQKSPASYDETKLLWMNNSFIKATDNKDLEEAVQGHLTSDSGLSEEEIADADANLPDIIGLHKDKASNLKDLAAEIVFYFKAPADYDADASEKFINADALAVLGELQSELSNDASDWQAEPIKTLIQAKVAEHRLKFPQLAMPLRLALTGTGNSPSIDLVLELIGKDEALKRINKLVEKHQNPQ